jgi:hypothetical protein
LLPLSDSKLLPKKAYSATILMEDPIRKAENLVRGVHDEAGKYTKPVLKRYPLLFSFLLVFSVAAILDGFRMLAEQIEIFEKHPSLLIIIGIVSLLLTGTLYKSLDKMK